MIKFTKYKNSDSLGTKYLFGINVYNLKTRPVLDIIIGKYIFVFYWVKK
jgi:hypothetical protein